jgi:fatty acid desaturase
MKAENAVVFNRTTDSKIFSATRWDIIPVLAGVLHCAYFFALFFLYPHLPIWAMCILLFIYSVSISWNINGISHNFIHTPYFRSHTLNRLFSLMESVTVGFSQVFYDAVHMQHHKGNMDRIDPATGKTIDWISFYRYGKNGKPENVWGYTFLSYIRDEPGVTLRELKKRGPAEVRWGIFELVCFVGTFILLGYLNWHYIILFLPFYYLGHSLSYLNGYYRHFGSNPDVPIAWGVSSYNWLYNITWFNNGYHAEHHYRPKVHWLDMAKLHEQIADEQRAAGVRVIKPPHALGFLDLPKDNDGKKSEPVGAASSAS